MIAFLIHAADLTHRAWRKVEWSAKIVAESFIEAQEIRRMAHRRWTAE